MESQLHRERLLETLAACQQKLRHSQGQMAGFTKLVAVASRCSALFPSFGRLFSRAGAAEDQPRLLSVLDAAACGRSLWILLRSFRPKRRKSSST
jgi:hypothetical protein